jgi:hypothetical protein
VEELSFGVKVDDEEEDNNKGNLWLIHGAEILYYITAFSHASSMTRLVILVLSFSF